MKQKSEILKQAFADIRFDEAEHHYSVPGSGVDLRSATGSIARFGEPFNARDAAQAYVSNRPGQGLDEDTVIWEWKENGRYAAHAGHEVHSFAENFETCKPEDFETQQDHPEWYDRVRRFYEVYGLPILRELKIYDLEFRCGGMVDKIYDVPGDRYGIDIVDWKSTNIRSYDTAFAGRCLKAPFSYMEDCKKSKQTLQLNLYRRIIELATPLRVRKMTVVMLRYEDEDGVPMTIDLPKVPDDDIDEAMLMLARGEEPQYENRSLFSF